MQACVRPGYKNAPKNVRSGAQLPRHCTVWGKQRLVE